MKNWFLKCDKWFHSPVGQALFRGTVLLAWAGTFVALILGEFLSFWKALGVSIYGTYLLIQDETKKDGE